MATYRNNEMPTDPSVKQGSRIVHPIYARFAGKDGKGDQLPKTVNDSNRNITPTNFPINVRLGNRLKNIDPSKTVPPKLDSCGYYRQSSTKNPLFDPLESSLSLEDFDDASQLSGPSTLSSDQQSIATKDNVTEKNKKSSIEQKRFYQRKFSGFSPVKLLPGKLFKFLRPPLQRRNSCPVLSVSESEAEAKLNETLARRNLGPDGKQTKAEGVSNERNHSCRLTKWTSHQELQRQDKDKVLHSQTSGNIGKNFKATKHYSFKVSENRARDVASDFPSLKSRSQNDESSVNRVDNQNEENAVKKSPDSPVIEKTVIIVSDSTSIIAKDKNNTFDGNVTIKSDNIGTINGVSIPMNCVLSSFPDPDKIRLSTNQSSLEINSNQKYQDNNITILSSDSTPNSILHPIQVIDNPDNTSLVNDKNSQTYPESNERTINVYSLTTVDRSQNCDTTNDNLLNFQTTRSDSINAIVENNLYTTLESESDLNDSSYKDNKSEYIKIKPCKSNNILYTPDSVNKSFSTFKSDPKSSSIISVQNNEIKSNEIQQNKQFSGNFTLVSPSNQQKNVRLQNGGSRRIYLPNGVTHAETDNSLDTDETYDINDCSIEYQSLFNKTNTENKLENGIKICDTSSSLNDKKIAIKEVKNPQPQLISITCSQSNKINHFYSSNTEKIPDNSEIKVSVVNNTNVNNDTLDFGECSLNSSTTDLQSEDINECYNVKLDAPEEVIVAGFHDFCHTMLSLEESLESHDTGTVKRRKVKPKAPILENQIKKNCPEEGTKIYNNHHENNSSGIVNKIELTNGNIQPSQKQENSYEDNASDKLLEKIQNSKQLEKMNIRDPDVIDAIAALDNSLREASEKPILSQRELSDIQSKLIITKKATLATEAKRRANVIKEDKIQCDNLIEEVLLDDIGKRVPSANKKPMAPLPPKRKNCIAVTISNSNAHHLSPRLPQTIPIHHLPEIKGPNIPTTERKTNVTNNSLLNGHSNEVLKSDYCLPGGDMKRMNVLTDAKDDSSSPPTSSVSAEDTNPTLPLQVSVDDNVNAGVQDVVACSRTSPCSVDSGTSSHNQGYFVVVAIDFGTTYSGYAFSFTRDPDNIHMMKKWDGGDPGVWNQKTPTTLLLSPEGTFHSFGFSARDYYHDLDVEEARGWLYFEKFKMTLHYSEHLSLDTEIAAANGKRMPAVIVFSHALRYFKDHALQELSDQSSTRILNEDVRWVVTVPAIWKQPAKQFMRAAAYKAGIASPEYPDQLLIALEPEAASIYCRRMRLHQLIPEETQYQRSLQWQKERDTESEAESTISEKDLTFPTNIGQGGDGTFTVGTRYMVVDCGGGTVDITVHELLDKQGTLKELQKASGGPYGSMGVDMEFEKFLCDIFGKDFMQHFKTTRPTGYVDLMIAFEARKRNASPFKSNPLNISLPFSFIDSYVKYTGSTVEAAIKKSNHKNVKWSQGMLRLEPTAMEALFQQTIEQIRKHIEDIINLEDLCIDYIFLVGGFAESLILQNAIKEAFSSKLKVVIPQGVSLAILKGAVLFGLDPTTVNIRRLRMTYGVGVLNHFIHGVHPREKLVIKNGKQWCADVFDKFVVNEQSVGVGDVVVRRYTPAKDGQSCSVIHIYCSEKDNVYFITDPGVKRCATLILDISDSRYIQSREIQTRMMFGDTEIKASALDVTTGKCVKAEIDFLNH